MRLFLSAIICIFLFLRADAQTDASLKIEKITDGFYVYTTYSMYQGNKISANGMYVITEKGALIFDSPWDTTQFQPLLDTIYARHRKKAILCIATHFHSDRTAGLEYYQAENIQTFTTKQTDDLSSKNGMRRAANIIEKDSVFLPGKFSFQTYYPGHGHAPDNIVIWFPKQKILYAGCLVKSTQDNTLGNLGDASISDYAATVEKVMHKFPKPSFIITGHNAWRDKGSLQHTLRMAKALKKDR